MRLRQPHPAKGDDPVVSDKPVVFLHVMKCGGTSVRAGLASGVAGHREGPDIFELDGGAAKAAAGGTHADNWKFRDALLLYVLEAMPPALVLGHFRYRTRYEPLLGSAHFVTVLREPVERLVSLYRYRRYKEGIDVPVSVSFDEFLGTKRWANEGHAYVDIFCGDDGFDPRSEGAIDAAVANLERLAVVGFTEDLDGFARGVAGCVGRPVSIPMLNESPAPKGGGGGDNITAASLEVAREICQPDIQVYERIRASTT
jgi:hypothetical protein